MERAETEVASVWVFHGEGARFASGVFTSQKMAEKWIYQYGLQGILTEYPLDVGVYDWAMAGGLFTPKRPEHTSPHFIQRFTSAAQKHEHYHAPLADGETE